MTKPISVPYTFGNQTGVVPASNIDDDFTSLTNSVNDFNTYSNYSTDIGSVNNYVINFALGITTTSLVAGARFQFIASTTNTGTSTLQVQINSVALGTVTIKLTDGSNLPANTIVTGAMVDVMYDGTNFQLMNDASGGTAIITDLSITGNLSVAGNTTSTKSISAASNIGAYSYGNLSYTDTNNFAVYQTSANSYAQLVIQNTSNGNAASADITVSNNVGNATAFYGNFGINSSTFSGSGSFNLANATYVSATSGDLVVGTTTSNAIHFVVNGGATDAFTVNANNTITFLNTTSAQSTTSTQLQTTGTVTVATASYANNTSGSVIGTSFFSNSSFSGTGAAATYTYQGAVVIQSPTFTYANATTITNAASVYIAGVPSVGTNATFTNAWSLMALGKSYLANATLDGTTTISGNSTFSGGTLTASYTAGTKLLVTGNDSVAPWTTSAPALQIASGTYTSTSTLTGTVVANSIAQPTFAATTAAQTITNAATLYIANSPAAGANITSITNPYALYVAAGDVYFGGASLTIGGSSANTNGVRVGLALSTPVVTYSSTTSYAANTKIVSFEQATLNASGGTIIGNASTLYLGGPPIAGTNVSFNNVYAFYVNSGNSYLGGNVTITGTINAANVSGGTLTAGYTAGTKLNITGNDSSATWGVSGIGLRIDSGTYTDTTSTGTVATVEAIHAIAQPTIAASNVTTFTNSATFYIANAPAAGTNATLTNPYSLYVASGATYLGGSLNIVNGGTYTTSLWNAIGLGFYIPAATYTGFTMPSQVGINGFGIPTIASNLASQSTTAATVSISGAPVAGTNVSFQTPDATYAIFVNGGAARFDGAKFWIAANNPSQSYVFSSFGTSGVGFSVGSATYTSTSTVSGNVTAHSIGTPTFTATTAAQTISNAISFYIAAGPTAGTNVTITNKWALYIAANDSLFNGGLYAGSASGRVGYSTGTGAGGAVTQLTSRTTGVTLNTPTGAITMFTAAGSATAATFTVTNSSVVATDTIILNQKSGTNLYILLVTAVAAGSFNITFYTTGGTASDAPVINYSVIKGAAT